jgi:hypothetical protein
MPAAAAKEPIEPFVNDAPSVTSGLKSEAANDLRFVPVAANDPNLAANDASFASEALSNVLERTHEAAAEIVDLETIEKHEVGFRAFVLGTVGNVLGWFPKDATPSDVQEFAAIVDAMAEGRKRLAAAANNESFQKTGTQS